MQKILCKKMVEDKCFTGALKIAMKAQHVDPDLENISQIIMVRDVHCFAETKDYGGEKDWYSILKFERTADELLIEKQFRKLALLLHPDENRFSGARRMPLCILLMLELFLQTVNVKRLEYLKYEVLGDHLGLKTTF